ncbi:dCTP deaminase [Thermoplasmatales archaeon SW_10_69_26]|jgi:dCTP deaminase|nr:MAG: dCTP deaminase [Thermoplasmatales archaeon SW_10_69_26]
MPVLADSTIQALVEDEMLGIDPFDPENLTPNGYDLSVAEVLLPDREPDTLREEGLARIPPRERFVVSTAETVTLGSSLCAQLWLRTTFARRGVMAAFGKVEAGFSGTLTISCFNAAREAVEIPIGERFCQIAFEALTGDAEALYEERSGNYQDQQGVTLANDG